MKIQRVKPILYIIIANIFVLAFGPALLYSVDVEIYRLLEPKVGRATTTIVQTLFSMGAVMVWLYLWRMSFLLLFSRLIKHKQRTS